LFATVDEFWFRPDRSPITDTGIYSVFRDPANTRSAGTSKVDPKIDLGRFGLTPASVMERMRFFLTAVSRAPDLNLYGKPRISVWPLADQQTPVAGGATDRRSAFDDVIAFCSTIAGKTYYFARTNSWDPTYDFETAGRTNANAASTDSRNKQLFTYLQKLTDLTPPGATSSFSKKYGADRDQILVEIFDYIRSTNLVDTGNKAAGAVFPPLPGPYPLAYTPGYDNLAEGATNKYDGSAKSNLGSGQVIPTIRKVNGAEVNRGFGRFVILSEAGLAFFRDTGADIPGFDTEKPTSNTDIPLRAILLNEMYTPSPGYPALSESYAYTVEYLDMLDPKSWIQYKPANPLRDTVPLKIARLDANFVEVDAWRGPDGRFFMPTRGFANQFRYDTSASGSKTMKSLAVGGNVSNPLASGDYSKYPFFSQKFYVSSADGKTAPTNFTVLTAPLKYKFYSLAVPAGSSIPPLHPKAVTTPIQTVTVNIAPQRGAPMTLPIPALSSSYTGILNTVGTAPANGDWNNLVIRIVELNGEIKGDIRLAMAKFDVPETYYSPAGTLANFSSLALQVQNFRTSWGRVYPGYPELAPSPANPNNPNNKRIGVIVPGQRHRSDKIIDLPETILGVPSPSGGPYGDFDRGISKHTDGPFMGRADEGNVRFKADDNPGGGGNVPYFRGAGGYDEVGANFFSPNRIIPSAVMFGSLPSGVLANPKRPWETLLFAPSLSQGHRGAQDPPDHYLLDLFSMPVVEPYAISEPLSTAGRVNLNARLAPFGYAKVGSRPYIERNTGLLGVLKGMYQLAVPSTAADSAHSETPLSNTNQTAKYRIPIDPFATVDNVISPKFDTAPGYFRSPSQICELDLLLETTDFDSPSKRANFWRTNGMTGDNGRERPYAHIYPRLTTKSNTYTVHAWAQSIAKNPATKEWDKFDETSDRVVGEYRGSTTIERFLDPNDEALLKGGGGGYDGAKDGATPLDPYYRFRVVNHKRFVAD